MTRVASLYLPQLAIERLRRLERIVTPPEQSKGARRSGLPVAIDDDPGECSVPRAGGWRPGARWARDNTPDRRSRQAEINARPAHQRPTMREMGRRSEAAEPPFRAGEANEERPDDAVTRLMPPSALSWATLWGKPMILVRRVGQREVVTAACPQAQDLGLHHGMAGAHARALVTDLEVRDAEPEMDQAVLDRLALHAVAHWTPTASPSAPDGLWLDLTGTTHLFGGETRFCRRLLGFLRRLGFSARIGIAGTPGAAHALARYGKDAMTIVASGEEAEAIAGMPLACLRLDAPALVAAARFGLERVADLYPMPRGPLAKRLGLQTVLRLDQARGIVAEPIVPVIPFEEPKAERRLLEPIGTAETLNQVIGDLVDDLVGQLQTRMLGARALALGCERVDGVRQNIGLGTARATRDAVHLKRMLGMRVERIDPGLGIERMTLGAPRVETLLPTPIEAALDDRPQARDVASLIDQLAGRVAPNALFRLTAVESDVPERAVLRTQPLGPTMGWPAWKRPVRLLLRPEPLMNVIALLPDHPPRRFAWRGASFEVARGDGPERIHGEWWRSARELWAVRDYFRVETTSGDRFWIFRRGDGVDAPTGDLSWHMHGFFG